MATPEPKVATPVAAVKQESALALMKRTVVDVVQDKVNGFIRNGELNLPLNYSVNNAIKSAWLILQDTKDKDGHLALSVCTRDSIANALLDMVVQGLNPTKDQGYFLVYGKTLVCQRSYFGAMAVTQMVNPAIDDFSYGVVYEGDTFKYGISNGKKIVSEHVQDIANIKKDKIIAAYSIALDKKGEPFRTEIMTFEQIKEAWKKSPQHPIDDKGNVKPGSEHGKFPDQFSLRTVINRLCKVIINASSDNALLLERINRNDELADQAVVAAEIEEEANQGDVIEIATGVTVEEKENLQGDTIEEKVETADHVATGRGPGF